jgi:hypothetical protein
MIFMPIQQSRSVLMVSSGIGAVNQTVSMISAGGFQERNNHYFRFR